MALVETQEVSLKIGAETSGQSDVAALADRIEALAREGGAAAPQFSELSAEIRRLGQQQVRIDGLQDAITSAKAAWVAVRDARHEVLVLDKALGDARGAGANKEAIKLLQAELRNANRELKDAERAWAGQKSALASARAETAGMGVDVRNLGNAQQRLVTEIEASKAAFAAQVEALRQAREAEQARALEARNQAAEEQRLAAIVTETKARMARAAQEQLAAEKRAYAESSAAAKRYDEQTRAIASGVQKAFSTIGIRSADTIRAEILSIQQGLQRLATEAKVSGTEFDRAWAKGQARIGALNAELRGSVDPVVNSMRRAGTEVDGLTTKLRPLAGALAAAFSVQQGVTALIDANVQAERLGRSLATIATPAFSAREQLGWLREMADRNGVAFDRLSQSFISFAASTRGTTLEGQKTREIYDAIVTSMGRMGRSSEEVSRALQAVGQIASKGTVSMEELRGQLAEAMPGAMQSLANGLGLTTAELIKMTSEGRLLAEDALPALQRELQKTLDATGPEKVAGMEAGWNRLRNAIERAMDAGQAKRDNAGNILDWLAAGVDRLVDRAGVFENSWGALLRAIETGDWKTYAERVDAYAAAIEASRDKAALAAEQHRILGNAAAKSGEQAQQAVTTWTALDNAYSKILTAVREQIAQEEKLAAARQAEGAASVALAQAFGSETEQREAALYAAVGNAVALKELAAQRQVEVGVLKAELAAKQAYVITTGDESKAHREAITNLQQTIAARAAETDRSTAQAQASRIAAEAARAEADAMADNSQRVGELRQAYEAAKAELDAVTEARAVGMVSTEAMTEAELAAGRAAYLYRDALKDEAAAIQANLGVKQAQVQLDQTGVQLAIAVAQRTYEVAKAKGDEKEATEALLRIKRLEADLAELQAKAIQAQAEAELLAVKNKREQAEASGRLTEQLKAELKAEQLSAEAKLLQGKISEETAAKLRDLANAAQSAGAGIQGSMNSAAAATSRVGEAAASAAASFWEMSEAAREAESETARLKRWEAESSAARQERSVSAGDPFPEALRRGLIDDPSLGDEFREAFNDFFNASLAKMNAGSQLSLIAQTKAAGQQAMKDAAAFVNKQKAEEDKSGVRTNRYEVRLRLGGLSRTVNVASASDAQSLTDFLEQLEREAMRAS